MPMEGNPAKKSRYKFIFSDLLSSIEVDEEEPSILSIVYFGTLNVAVKWFYVLKSYGKEE